jgi:Sulfotransferase family
LAWADVSVVAKSGARMILSHKHKFIFVKTFKTGGSSLEYVLPRHCGPEDVITPLEPKEEAERLAQFGVAARNHFLPWREYAPLDLIKKSITRNWKKRFHEHSSAHEIRRIVGERIWGEYFTFTIVRNPIDRAVSRYYYTNEWYRRLKTSSNHAYGKWEPSSFDQFIRHNPALINENWPMYTESDEIIVDFVVRYEHLERDLATVSERIGMERNIYEDMKMIRAKSGIRPSKEASIQTTASQKAFIALLCDREMEAFGYDAGTPAA